MAAFRLSSFRVEVTPPIGHPLCAGWVQAAVGVSDPLFAMGVVLTSHGPPVVLCAVDWCEISNDEHAIWRQTLAAAVDTTADRVAVHCGHQHDAPWPDRGAQALVDVTANPPKLMDVDWCQAALERVAEAVRSCLWASRPVTHVGIGQAEVLQVASNRRILGADGKVRAVRFTRCADPSIRAEPEGLIDPMLKTVSFWDGDTKLASLHYYAVHPCSYYGDGWVTGDFVAHARDRLASEDAGAIHIYFTGCGGNTGPGKYNDGARANRPVLAERMYQAMAASERATERLPAGAPEWLTDSVALPPDARRDESELVSTLSDPSLRPVDRVKAALRLAYLRRLHRGEKIPFACLWIGEQVAILH